MPTLLLLFVWFAASPAALAEGADPLAAFEAAYRQETPSGREKLLKELLRVQRFPAVGAHGRVTFLYVATGDEKSVSLVGDFRQRNPFTPNWDMRGESFTRIAEDGPVFMLSRAFEPDARVDYKLVVDGVARPDPLNPLSHESGVVGPVSELAMPEYRAPTEHVARAGIPLGTVRKIDEPWARPEVNVYLPVGYDPARRYPVLYTADGNAWRQYIGLPTILDNLIGDGSLRPVIAVMIDPDPERSSWYQFNPEYLSYLERVIAHVDRTYSTLATPEGRMHLGSSAGGRASLYVALERPNLFRNVALLSPALTAPVSVLAPYLTGRRRPDKKLHVLLSAGSYEGAINDDAKWLEAYLRKAGVSVIASYSHQGHSFAAWRGIVPNTLRAVFGTRAKGQKEQTPATPKR